MAWRWFHGNGPFLSTPGDKEQGVTKMAKNFVRYHDIEPGFVTQAMGMIPNRVSFKIDADVLVSDAEATCTCVKGTRCCAGSCQTCQEE